MAKGGARVRSGPDADPSSARSEKRGLSALTVLPSEGRKGRAPAFPLPAIKRSVMVMRDGKPSKVADDATSKAFRKRELEVWAEVWKTPQAVAWERETWRWPTIAKYCRISVSTESEPDASAALLSRERELRNEIGLTPDGLKQNGWSIAPNEVAAKAATRAPAKKTAAAPTRRLRSVSGG